MIQIDSNTKIATILKENPASIEAIATIAPPLQKLRNVVLRKLMAPRVTIAEAARMGGCTVDDFAAALKPLGFQFTVAKEENTTLGTARPQWLIEREKAVDYFDVREILSGGRDPLKDITAKFKTLQPGDVLCIVNSFEPVPLVRLFEKEGALAFTEQTAEKEFYTFFLKGAKKGTAGKQADIIQHQTLEGFQQQVAHFDGKLEEVNVCHMEMPLPMQTILQSLATLPAPSALYVYHKKVPMYLLNDLESRDYTIHIYEVAEGDVRLLIHKPIH